MYHSEMKRYDSIVDVGLMHWELVVSMEHIGRTFRGGIKETYVGSKTLYLNDRVTCPLRSILGAAGGYVGK